jgi:hypothetical protein
MRRWRRAALTACILGLAPLLSACESFDLDKIQDMFDQKKPISGDRKALFPQGVPGVPQGVPADLMKGHAQAEAEAQARAAAVPAPGTESGVPAKPKAKPKPKPKPKPETATAADPPAQSRAPQSSVPPPSAPWPTNPQQQQSAWPTSPGTVSR